MTPLNGPKSPRPRDALFIEESPSDICSVRALKLLRRLTSSPLMWDEAPESMMCGLPSLLAAQVSTAGQLV
jgi:hypothetical protein